MTAIKILAETEDTVTLSRQDWAHLLGELEDAEDRLAVRSARAREAAMGKEAIRQSALMGEEAMRLLEGESPVKVWRQKRGLTQRGLAKIAGVAASYLADIENGRKPGSAEALSRLAGALRVSIGDLITEQQRRRDPGYGPVYLQLRPYTAGVGRGARGANPNEERFASVNDAWEMVRAQWQRLRIQSPEIVDEQRLPIFGVEDLLREMEPELFDPAPKKLVSGITFDEAARWSGKLSSYVMHATVDGESVRCRVLEEVFRDCLDDPHARTKDFPRLFQRYRSAFELAFRKAIEAQRFSSWHDREATKLRREIVIGTRDFDVLVSAGAP